MIQETVVRVNNPKTGTNRRWALMATHVKGALYAELDGNNISLPYSNQCRMSLTHADATALRDTLNLLIDNWHLDNG